MNSARPRGNRVSLKFDTSIIWLGLTAGLLLGLIAARPARAATYNLYFNGTEQGANSTANPSVTVQAPEGESSSNEASPDSNAAQAATPAPTPAPEQNPSWWDKTKSVAGSVGSATVTGVKAVGNSVSTAATATNSWLGRLFGPQLTGTEMWEVTLAPGYADSSGGQQFFVNFRAGGYTSFNGFIGLGEYAPIYGIEIVRPVIGEPYRDHVSAFELTLSAGAAAVSREEWRQVKHTNESGTWYESEYSLRSPRVLPTLGARASLRLYGGPWALSGGARVALSGLKFNDVYPMLDAGVSLRF